MAYYHGSMLIAVATFLAGLAGLLVGGHLVVDGASKIGARVGLPPMVIGLTIVAAGTSAPELAVVLQSVAADDTPLAVGSIIGSNIANVLLVLGLAAAFGTIHVANRVVRIDIPIMIAASFALLVLSLDGWLTRIDGLLLFGALVVFVGWTLRAASSPNTAPDARRADGHDGHGEPVGPEAVAAVNPGSGVSPGAAADPGRLQRLPATVVALVIGVGALAFAARFVVSGAEEIATRLGVPELIIGLTIVALGTSAPEIVTTVIAALTGRRDLAVGNAVGSNIFNILLVLGASSAIVSGGIDIGRDAVELDLPIMVAAAVACLPIVFWDNKLDRWEGAVFVAYYVAYVVFLVLDGTGHRASDPFALVMLGFVLPLTVLTVAVVIVRQRRAGDHDRPHPVRSATTTSEIESNEISEAAR